MTWDGKERRSRVSSYVAGDLTTKEEKKLRRHYRWNAMVDQLFEKRYIISTIVFMQFILLGVGFFGISNTNRQAGHGVAETRKIVNFISQYIQSSAQAGATRNNNVASGLSCLTQVLVTLPENRTQTQIEHCQKLFNDAIVPPPTKAQIDALLKTLGEN